MPRRPSASDTEPVLLLRALFVLIAFLGVFSTAASLMPDGDLHDASTVLTGDCLLIAS